MLSLISLLTAAAIGFALSKWWKVPPIPLLLVCGFIVGQLGVAIEPEARDQMIELGVSFLVFFAGAEMSPSRVGDQKKAAVWTGLVQFVVLGAAALLLARVLGFGASEAGYLSMAVAASSTLVVVNLLSYRQQLFEPFGRLAMGVLLLQDVAIICLMVVAAEMGDGLTDIVFALGALAGLVAASAVCARWVVPWLLERYSDREETLLLAILSILFVFLGLGNLAEIPAVAGAFLAGVALSPFPARGIGRGLLDPLADFFLAVFFTALGTLAVVSSLSTWLYAVAFAALVIVLTPLLIAAVASQFGLTARSSLESGLLLSQTSEFSLLVGLQGAVLGIIDEQILSIIVLFTALTMLFTPVSSASKVAEWLMRFYPRSPRAGKVDEDRHGHIVLIGSGTVGREILERLDEAGAELVVIDYDPAVVSELRERGITALLGDAADPTVLEDAGVRRAKLVIATVYQRGMLPVLGEYTHDVPVMVHVFEQERAEAVEGIGATPLLYSEAAVERFFEWFEEHRA